MMDDALLSSSARSAPITRIGVAKNKACLQCTKSKRRCDRSSPQCLRCLDKGAVCQYPPSRRRAQYPHPPNSNGLFQESDRQDLAPFPSEPVVVEKIPKPPTPISASSSRRFSSIRTFVRNPTGHSRAARSSSGPDPLDSLANDRWFLTPDTFVKLHDTGDSPDRPVCYQDRSVGDETVEFLEEVQKWMKQWAVDGHSPAVHRYLFSGGYMPECVEDAYTVLATYHSSTNPQIRKTALQIADRRASRLIVSFRVPQLQHGYPDACESVLIDTRTHLARTLALLTYQVMGLFDTDIRARSNAEDYIETLNCWALQMLESARLDCVTAEIETVTPFNVPETAHHHEQPEDYQTDLDPSYDKFLGNATSNTYSSSFMDEFLSMPTMPTPSDPNPESSPDTPANTGTKTSTNTLTKNPFIIASKQKSSTGMIAESERISSLWRAWLIAESVRRVYITVIYMQCVYTTLKHGTSSQSTCPGGMNFTARSGLWDAPSAYSWFNQVRAAADKHKNSRSSSFLMVQTTEAWKVIEEATPKDVDEFTHAILLICFGKEWVMERWFDEGGALGEKAKS